MTHARTLPPIPAGPPTGEAALHVAVIGPAHPAPGRLAAHTTLLAHHLADAGHDVTLVSWASLLPGRAVRGERPVGSGAPGPVGTGKGSVVAPFPRTIRALGRARPDSWLRVGRRLRDVDAVVVVATSPSLAPAHLALLRAAGALPPTGTSTSPGDVRRPRSVLVCGEVLPHETRPGDAALVGSLLRRVDSVVVHTPDEARVASGLGATRVATVELPPEPVEGPHGPDGPDGSGTGSTRLLCVGPERAGLDLLLAAVAQVPEVTLTVLPAGPASADPVSDDGTASAVASAVAADPRLQGRVEVRDVAVSARQHDELAVLLGGHDVLALTAGSVTAAQGVALAHAHGLPVLAPDAPPFSNRVTDGVDGLLVADGGPDPVAPLAAALRRLRDPELRRRLADDARTPDLPAAWATYLGLIESLSVDVGALTTGRGDHVDAPGSDRSTDPDDSNDPFEAEDDDGSDDRAGGPRSVLDATAHTVSEVASGLARRSSALQRTGPGRAVGRLAARGAGRGRAVRRRLESRRAVVALQARDLPDEVLVTDVLGDPEQADEARRLARSLGLPRTRDGVAAWAALGTLAAILRIRDDGRRQAVVVDETGPRSVLSRWSRAVGFAPVEIDFTGLCPSVAALDVDTGSLDVIARVHPRGCDADDIDHVLEQASWALRVGGLLVVTVPIGPPSADGALGPSDVRGILARAHDVGFVLVGDLDGDVNARMREAAARARSGDAAYGLVRLALRRR
jgi:glycosyltransferase involved in cell wall biosynthesis/SAM-dependent methyltransferase